MQAGASSRYVFVNEADSYLASDNQTQIGYTTVVDAVKQQVGLYPFPLPRASLVNSKKLGLLCEGHRPCHVTQSSLLKCCG